MLDDFLAKHEAVADERVVWALADGSTMPLHVAYYVTRAAPPEELVTSVRAVVLSGETVLTMRNRDAVHALPGGRRERGETFEETLRREVLEEAGWRIAAPRPLGIVHLEHLAPKPPDYAFVHPDFLWAIYVAEAAEGHAPAVPDDYELEAGFEPIETALRRVDLGSRVYVRAAVQARAEGA